MLTTGTPAGGNKYCRTGKFEINIQEDEGFRIAAENSGFNSVAVDWNMQKLLCKKKKIFSKILFEVQTTIF